MDEIFTRIANRVSLWAGQAGTFVLALSIVIVWGVSGPLFQWSDTWQLVINTGTTIVTFLMVFLIQNTQNRDTEAMQIKLDELIRVTRLANNELLDLEELEESELDQLRERYEEMARQAKNLRATKEARKPSIDGRAD